MINRPEVSDIDKENLISIRQNVCCFLKDAAMKWGDKSGILLDIAPQDHEGARPFFGKKVEIETLDINPEAQSTYTANICITNESIPSGRFDIVVCTEVLEHVLNPFSAICEIYRMLKPGGVLLASSPFNFRIHGPLPDCWRFTEHGWRALLVSFEDVRIHPLEDPERFLMPIHYAVSAMKPLQ
jgi:SAM-dependent methyltransferase